MLSEARPEAYRVSFWVLIQWGWIRIVAPHRGLPSAFTKITDVNAVNNLTCSLVLMLI